ncbi:pheST operon leader peptide PheM [Enterobacteriaceae bacterium Kacie_13]|nr:pheST operon leader peptide PheM [Enterobacteriaceae bacterium Kacie_13]
MCSIVNVASFPIQEFDQQGNASMNAAIFRFFFYFSA